MTTSSSYSFDPNFASIFDEAAERAGLDPATLSSRHVRSAKMSLNLMFTEWAARDGDSAYRMDELTSTVTAGVNYFDPATGVFDITDMVVTYNSQTNDVPMVRIGRQEYLNIAHKTDAGQPNQYYVDQSTLNAPRVYLYPVPDATCVISYDCMRFNQTLRSLSETLDVNRLWLDAVAAGLALRLAEKYNQARVSYLEPKAEGAYRTARISSKGRADVMIGSYGFGSGMRRRRS